MCKHGSVFTWSPSSKSAMHIQQGSCGTLFAFVATAEEAEAVDCGCFLNARVGCKKI